jgi:ferrous iron transport protein B
MATRTLEDEREKNRTIRLMTCFSCGAKAPIWALLAGIGAMAGFAGDIFVFTIYLGGIACAVIFALFMKLFSKDQYVSPFIMELPSYHLPQFRNVMAHLWEKLKHYVIKASTIIAASLIVIWFLSNFGWAFWNGLVEIEDSMLASIGKVFGYIFYPMGFSWDVAPGNEPAWFYSVASVTGLVAKEVVADTFITIAGGEEAVESLVLATGISVGGLLAFLVFNLLTVPCFAAVATAKAELPKGQLKWTILFWLGTSYTVALMVRLAFDFFWTLAIIIPVIALIFVGAYLWYRRACKKEELKTLGA